MTSGPRAGAEAAGSRMPRFREAPMTPPWYRGLGAEDRRAFWTSLAGFCLNAMDVQLYAFVLPTLFALWGLTHTEAGLLASATLVSSALGGWAGGLLADRFGRIRVLRVTIVWLALSTALCGMAGGFGQLLLARLLQGIGFGAEWSVGAVFIAEIAAPQNRARMVGMAQSGWAVGWGLAGATALAALALLPPDLGWRVLFLVGIVPAVLVFWLRLRLRETAVFASEGRRSSPAAIFAPSMAWTTLRGGLLATGMHGGYWAVATWWPTILSTERGFSVLTSGVHLAALIGGSFLGYVVGASLGDRVGRRATLIGFAAGGTVLVLLCTQLPLPDAALLLLSVPLGFFALGMFSVIGALLSELFPTAMRGSGLGFCYNFGRGLAGITPVLVGGSTAALGLGHALGLYVTAAYGLVILAAVLLPETRGRRLAGGGPQP